MQGSRGLHTKVSDVLTRQVRLMSFSSSPSSSSEEISWKMLNLLWHRPAGRKVTVNRSTLRTAGCSGLLLRYIEASNLWASLRPSPRIALPSWSCPWLASSLTHERFRPPFAPPTSQLQPPANSSVRGVVKNLCTASTQAPTSCVKGLFLSLLALSCMNCRL